MIVNDPKELCYHNYIGKNRALCIDYGDKRIGLAVSDINWIISSPLKTLPSHGIFNTIFDILKQYGIGVVVIGAPRTLSGQSGGKQFEKIKKFVTKLEELQEKRGGDLKIVYWDERFSSVAANRYFEEAGMSVSKRKENIDKVAASFILQGFINFAKSLIGN